MYPTGFPSAPPVSPQGGDGKFVRPTTARGRSISTAEMTPREKEKEKAKGTKGDSGDTKKAKLTKSESVDTKPKVRR